VSPFRYTRLIFGVSIGVGVFGERLDLPMFVGGAVVIGAGLYIWWQGKMASAQASGD
jgi:drug/metabolite transporter (DMT)-like permease